MSSEGEENKNKLHRFYSWFDPEAAAVVTILLGLFQLMLSVPVGQLAITLPKFFILPLVIGVIIIAGGSLTMANERFPSRQLLQGCACGNIAGLVAALLAFCLYCFTLNSVHKPVQCGDHSGDVSDYEHRAHMCPERFMAALCWGINLLLLLYDIGAMILHCILSVSAIKGLKLQ